jgi:hypothetical protein
MKNVGVRKKRNIYQQNQQKSEKTVLFKIFLCKPIQHQSTKENDTKCQQTRFPIP